jgi:hypothetical protein
VSESHDDNQNEARPPRRIANWLQSVIQRRSAPASAAPHSATSTPPLLQRAAECYAQAGWDDDASRVFEQLGDDLHAAPYHERQGRWKQAALCYARAGDWQRAARCYISSGQPDEAAECLIKAGQMLDAAWTWAHMTHRYHRAEAVLREFAPQSDPDRLAVQLTLARCEAGTNEQSQAAARLFNALTSIRDLPPDFNRRRLHDWALLVADVLHRPDLTALLHATAVISGMPQAHEQWEEWAMQVLGDTTGVPQREELRNGEQT